MTDAKEKIGFRETISLLGFGFKLVGKMTPGYIPLMLFQTFITAAQPLVVLFFSARILNELTGAQEVSTIVTLAALTLGLSLVLSVAKALITREIETTSGWERVYTMVQVLQAERYITMDYVHAEDAKISEILARMDTQAAGNGLGLLNMFFYPAESATSVFSLILSALLLTGGLSTGVGGMSGWPGLILYAVFFLGITWSIIHRSKEKRIIDRIYKENAKANTAAGFNRRYLTADQAAKDIRINNQQPALSKIFKESFVSSSWLSFFFFEGRIDGFNVALLSAISGGVYLLTGLNALTGGVTTAGGIVQGVGATMTLATAVGTLISLLGQLYNNSSYLKPMREYLTLPDVLVKGTKPVPEQPADGYRFEFKNVSFRYPGAQDYALSNLDLSFQAGKRMAVVGLNGSGKTTMIKLLCRLYDPTEGEIQLDGVNIKEYDYDQYIGLFSVVFQDYELFPVWLGQNVATSGDYDAGRVRASLTGAGFAGRLETMQDGLDTILYKSFDENGTQISGGEAQKIALARALYRDAPVVILDEPTAALDPIAEFEVYTTFDETIGNKTAVFISHRLSSCRFCHDISVFNNGRLVQRGTHEALLKEKGGLYLELWTAQAQHYV